MWTVAVSVGGRGRRRVRGRPVTLDLEPAVLVNRPVPGRQLAIPPQNALRVRHVLIGEIRVERHRVDFPRHARKLQQSLQLAAEEQSRTVVSIEQRLLSEPIASEKQALSPRIPNGQREHPAEPLDALRPVFLIQMDDRFGVAVGAKAMAPRLEIGPQFLVVVDFAVEGDPNRLIFIGERLQARDQIDDREPPETERGTGLSQSGTTIRQRLAARRRRPAAE